MALFIEPIYTDGIAQISYLIGDDSEGLGAVIDPRPDCGVYLELAREKGIVITRIFETHIHADFMSGARELANRLGGSAKISASMEGGAKYGFEVEGVHAGDTFCFGDLRLEACHTPGHTPEHISYLAYQSDAEKPYAVFSGDTLFVDSVGRPDLLGEDETRELAEQLFTSIHSFYRELDSGVLLYPGHGAGSACGPQIGDRMFSTVGYEKAHNDYLSYETEDVFVEKVLDAAPEEPRHYRPMKDLNAKGPPVIGGFPPVEALTAEAFADRSQGSDILVLDTRDTLAFGGGHIPGAINIAGQGELSVWSGWLIEFDTPLYLVLGDDSDLERVISLLWRTGHTNVKGYLAGGIMSWLMDGREIESVEQVSVRRLRAQLGSYQVLDVRSTSERQKGYISGSTHLFLPEIAVKARQKLDSDRPVVTYCASGFRASVAASILQRVGFESVATVPGSWGAWKSAGYEVETPQSEMAETAG